MSGHAQQSDYQYLQALQVKLKQNPNDIQTLILLGFIMFEPFHNPEEAEKYLLQAIHKDPNNVDARFWLAKVYYHEFIDEKKTKQILEEALKINPNRADCLSLMASVLIGIGRKPEEYVAYLERAVEQEPDWVLTQHFLASVLLKLGRFTEAENHAKQALSLLNSRRLPKDIIGEYYESVVTGRSESKYSKDRLESLLKEIQSKKNNRSL